MNADEKDTIRDANRMEDELVSAEAELKAAQEALAAAKVRLAKLKEENPATSEADGAGGTEAAELEQAAGAGVEATEAVTAGKADEGVETASATGRSNAEETATAVGSVAEAAGAPAPPPGYATQPSSAEMPPCGVAYAPPSYGAPTANPYMANSYAPNAGTTGTPPQQPYAGYAGYAAPVYGQPQAQQPYAPSGGMPGQPYSYGQGQPHPQPQGQPGAQPYTQPVMSKDHVAAGLLAIFLGLFGIHKFYLGYNKPGFIMLAVSIIGGIFTFGLAAWIIWIVAVIEGIVYLTKSQSDFEQIYLTGKREWF